MKKRMLYLMAVFMFGTALAADKPFKNLPEFIPDAMMTRADIPSVYKWDIRPLSPNIEAWNAEMLHCQEALRELQKMQNSLNTTQGISAYLKAYFQLDEKINRLTLYANMQRDVESTDQEIIARHEKALSLTEELMGKSAALRQSILNLSAKEMEDAQKSQPEINKYLPYINSLRRRAIRVLSPGEEKLLSIAGDNLWAQIDLNELPSASEKAFRALIAEMTLPMVTGPENDQVRLSFSNYGRLRGSSDRNVRKNTVAAMFGTLKGYENTFATTLGEQARYSLFLSRARGYETVLEAYLDKDELTPAVYMNLINTVKANVKPLHKYVELRKKTMEIDEVHLYDLYVPMVEQATIEMDYNTGSNYILKALEPLGEDYINQLKLGMDPENGWIDLYPSRNKNSGAFSTATYGIHPYVKMNFQNSFNDVSTLAHEYGHALHSQYAMNEQSHLSWRYAPFLAEIASTCNEALLSRYMIDNASSKQDRIWLLSELLETIRTTIYRQTLFAEFELKLHQLAEKGEPINAAKLNALYADLLRTYYGPDYTIDENDSIEWAYIPHFYYKYYVFTYATGLSSGIAFAEKILEEGPEARDAYLGMLKGGSSKPPLALLQNAGLDLTKPEAIAAALKLFDKTLDELNTLIDK